VKSVVVDSGFLIGLFDEKDPLHPRSRGFLKDYRGRFLTTEAVLTEALALLSSAQQLGARDPDGGPARLRRLPPCRPGALHRRPR